MKELILTLLIIANTSSIRPPTNYLLKSIKASIQGTSSLHAWQSQITKVEFKGDLQSTGNTLKTIHDVQVKIAVDSIKSKEGKTMDRKTYNAFKSGKNPFIIYTASNATVTVDAAKVITIEAAGTLTMAGVSNPVSLTAKGKMLPDGDLELSISKKLKMTEFKMKPPTVFMGAIKVGDEITVNFDMVLTQAK